MPLLGVNALFDKGREGFLGKTIGWDDDDIRLVAANITGSGTLYSPNLATDDFLNDVPGGSRVKVSGSFVSKTIAAGVADADDVTLTSVTGDTIEALVIYAHSGTDSSSPLISYIELATGLPITPNGADILIQWDAGSNKIFKL